MVFRKLVPLELQRLTEQAVRGTNEKLAEGLSKHTKAVSKADKGRPEPGRNKEN